MGNIVAIVGRPNVGKSTFFNRLIQRREAIVDAVSGVTRDRHYGKSDWNGREFSLIDKHHHCFRRRAHKMHHKHLGKKDSECFGMLIVPFKYFKR